MLNKLLYISILFLLPLTANALCFYEENPVNLTVEISRCDEQGFYGKILSGLEKDDLKKDFEHSFRFSDKSENNCQIYKDGRTVKISVLRDCCDTPGQKCYFGRVLTLQE
jgi:hypothetical protein